MAHTEPRTLNPTSGTETERYVLNPEPSVADSRARRPRYPCWVPIAAAIGRVFSSQVNRAASAHTQLLCALDFGIGPSYEVAITGQPGAADTTRMLRVLRGRFIPNKVVLLRPNEPEAPPITRFARFTRHQPSFEGKATAYVCTNYACQAPPTDAQEMLTLLSD